MSLPPSPLRRGARGVLPVLVCLACARGAARGPDPPARAIRHGPERLVVAYVGRYADAERSLFHRINRDRLAHGVPAVAYEPRASLVGDRFCLDQALGGYTGHWDAGGRAPYVRWGLAGGLDYHVQNTASYSISDGRLDRPLVDLLIGSHEEMMAERPPADGHRRTILDPDLTHVGIGVAAVGGQFRMSQEFTSVRLAWMDVPDRPLPAGGTGWLRGRPLPGWRVARVEVRHEPPPRPLSVLELRRRGGYAYPDVTRTLRPDPPPGFLYAGRTAGDFSVSAGGEFSVSFRLDSGPGLYFVVCFVGPWPPTGAPPHPATAAMLTALP